MKLSPNVKIPKWEASPATNRGINTLKPVLALSPIPSAMALRVSIFISISFVFKRFGYQKYFLANIAYFFRTPAQEKITSCFFVIFAK
jgi:hypothetical protein